jgi:hypothetical protein
MEAGRRSSITATQIARAPVRHVRAAVKSRLVQGQMWMTQRSHLRFRRESTISVTLVSAGPTAARRRELAYVGNVGF